ncbi:LLM class F420-dependent oxidoreductase [Actinacidiphila sp. ITFR-21]|uniref:LLM class F420-dependent oxidoreductase n=1 Tax=Actinacidiphila sp. ITFR-21 TaxID=3075199 RepID=UPI00288C42EE|nr:LLM class F420-dependent oxidoreductase [Streptomyces sp. ITFR-21]WNI19444.1 LLM class F420-dependent oxidoreductase [Streptomyces sp. ITFR-21]
MVRIGAVFPQTEIGDNPDDISLWARAVERAGYRHIVAYDHVLGAGTDTRPDWTGYTVDTPFHEVFVLLGYLAAFTTVTELVTGVLVLPQRQTALVAKQAAQVDVLSRGRLRLGVGVGWNAVEYGALGESFTDRGRRSEEQVELLRALWSRPQVTFEGRWHHVDNAGIKPRPVRGSIPVWFGGQAEATLRRIARLGDGWFPQSPPDDDTRRTLERLDRYLAQAGRQRSHIGVEARLSLSRVAPSERLAFAEGWARLGATHLTVDTMGLGLRTAAEHVAALEEALATIGPIAAG